MELESGLQTQGVRLHTPRLVGSLPLSGGHLRPSGGRVLILGSPEEEFCASLELP